MRLQTAALEAAANGVIITDAKGTIQWVNRAFMELTGYSAEEAIGENPRVLKSASMQSPITKSFGRLFPRDTFGQENSSIGARTAGCITKR